MPDQLTVLSAEQDRLKSEISRLIINHLVDHAEARGVKDLIVQYADASLRLHHLKDLHLMLGQYAQAKTTISTYEHPEDSEPDEKVAEESDWLMTKRCELLGYVSNINYKTRSSFLDFVNSLLWHDFKFIHQNENKLLVELKYVFSKINKQYQRYHTIRVLKTYVMVIKSEQFALEVKNPLRLICRDTLDAMERLLGANVLCRPATPFDLEALLVNPEVRMFINPMCVDRIKPIMPEELNNKIEGLISRRRIILESIEKLLAEQKDRDNKPKITIDEHPDSDMPRTLKDSK